MSFNYEDKFIEIFKEELNLNKQLLDISNEKMEIIRKNDLSQLRYITHEEQNIVRQIIELEKLRDKIIKILVDSMGIDEITDIKELIKSINPEKAQELLEITDELRVVLKDLKSINDLNSTILGFALEYIELNLNLMTSVPSPNLYGKNAGEKADETTNRFDNKF